MTSVCSWATAGAKRPNPWLIIEDKASKTKEKPDFTVGRQKYKATLLPAALLIARYFAAELAAHEPLFSGAGVITLAAFGPVLLSARPGPGGRVECNRSGR